MITISNGGAPETGLFQPVSGRFALIGQNGITVDGESRQAFFVYLADGGGGQWSRNSIWSGIFHALSPIGSVVDATADSQLAPAAR